MPTEQAAALAEGLGIHTLYDVLTTLPVRHDDHRTLTRIAELRSGQEATLRVHVRSCRRVRTPRRRREVVEITFEDDTGELRLTSFNLQHADILQPSRPGQPGSEVLLTGTVELGHRRLSLSNYEFEFVRPGDDVPAFRPVYRGCAGATPRQIARLVARLAMRYAASVPDPLPDPLEAKHNFPTLAEALRTVHAPSRATTADDLARAKERLAYAELFLLETAVLLRREALARIGLPPFGAVGDAVHRRILARLPYQPTADQHRAFDDVRSDFAGHGRMLRLLQGDVGTGKTAVAVYALLATVAAGAQGALLAPTEVLAQQHEALLRKWLAGSRVRLRRLSGSTSASARRDLLAAMRAGEVDIVVGTHALLEPDVAFARLAMVVIDEQHKFGVRQRQALVDKGDAAHVLVMTATPIPRTLALTAYGEMDVTTLRERPPGRRHVKTRIVPTEPAGALSERERRAWRYVRDRLAEGEQAYVVCPAVQDVAGRDKANVERAAADVRTPERAGPDVRLGVLHGGMSSDAKWATLEAFARGETRLLVASTVVEVGVDVPRATMMLILQADMLGMSQLHQLRGRVGRGGTGAEPVCFLFASPDVAEDARQRLRTIRDTDDGFEIAEKDLAMRGAGEVYGTRQSGMPRHRLADLREHAPLLERARDDARATLAGERLDEAAVAALVRRHFGPDFAVIGSEGG